MKKLSYLFLISLFICSCEGSEGPTGPAGKDGVANIYTENFTIDADNASSSEGVYLNQISMPEITQEVVNNGAVSVEIQISEGWLGLPWTIGNDINDDLEVDETIEVNYIYEEGNLYIAHISSSSFNLRSDIQEGPYKVTIIPPSKTEGNVEASVGHKITGNIQSFIEEIK